LAYKKNRSWHARGIAPWYARGIVLGMQEESLMACKRNRSWHAKGLALWHEHN